MGPRRARRMLRGHTDQVEGVAVSGDGRKVVTGSGDHTARIGDTSTGRTPLRLAATNGDIEGSGLQPGRRFVATAGDDQTARVWDAATGQRIDIFRGHTDELEGVAFSPDARYLVTAAEDKEARTYRCELCTSIEGVIALAP
jgi:WD40 repeat protein